MKRVVSDKRMEILRCRTLYKVKGSEVLFAVTCTVTLDRTHLERYNFENIVFFFCHFFFERGKENKTKIGWIGSLE